MGEDGLGWPGWDDAAVLEGAIPPNFTEKKKSKLFLFPPEVVEYRNGK